MVDCVEEVKFLQKYSKANKKATSVAKSLKGSGRFFISV